MQAESLEVLEGAQIAPAQARAIVRAIEIEMSKVSSTLATKEDLRLEMHDLGETLRAETAKLRAELAQSAGELRAELGQSADKLRAELARSAGELRAELRLEIAKSVGDLRGEMQALIGGSVRQMYMALLGQMAVLLGFLYFFAAYVR